MTTSMQEMPGPWGKPMGRRRFHTRPGPHIQSLAHSGASHTNPCTLGAYAHSLSHSGDLADTGGPPALRAGVLGRSLRLPSVTWRDGAESCEETVGSQGWAGGLMTRRELGGEGSFVWEGRGLKKEDEKALEAAHTLEACGVPRDPFQGPGVKKGA